LLLRATGGGLTLAQGITFDGGAGAAADTLRVQGTTGADRLAVRPQPLPPPAGLVAYQSGANAIGVRFTGTELVQLVGQGGNDTYAVDVLPVNVTIIDSAGNDTLNGGAGNDLIFGCLGNDTLNGGTGNNVLSGGDGDDNLRSGTGRNVMIGGLGTDDIRGNPSGGARGDLLIGGRTLYDDSQPDLVAILAEWSSARTLAQRRARLTTGLGRNGTPFLRTTAPNPSVLDDGAADAVFGGARFNWLLPS
jgi:Ca2+-binding RTX toxin-like protein